MAVDHRTKGNNDFPGKTGANTILGHVGNNSLHGNRWADLSAKLKEFATGLEHGMFRRCPLCLGCSGDCRPRLGPGPFVEQAR